MKTNNTSSIKGFRYFTFVITIFTFCLIALPTDCLRAELVDKVIAVVNTEVITLSELNEELKETEQRIYLTVPVEKQEQALYEVREQALNSIIDKKLIIQKAKEARVSASEQEIDRALSDVKRKSSMTDEQFVHELNKAGLSLKTYRDNLKSQILQRKIINYDIRSKIVISDAKIKDYYENEYKVETKGDEFYLLQIGVRWKADEGADENTIKKNKKQALDRAKRIHNLAMSGEDFGSLAEEYSDLPSAQDRGDIGSFTLDDMSATMKGAVAPLSTGDISKIIETPAGYQFFKLISSAGGQAVAKAPYDEVKDAIKAKLFEQEMQREFKEWVTKLKDDAYIQKL